MTIDRTQKQLTSPREGFRQAAKYSVDVRRRNVDLLELWGWADESLRRSRAHVLCVSGVNSLSIKRHLKSFWVELQRSGWITLIFEGQGIVPEAEHTLSAQLLEVEINVQIPDHVEITPHQRLDRPIELEENRHEPKPSQVVSLVDDDEVAWRSINFELPEEHSSTTLNPKDVLEEEKLEGQGLEETDEEIAFEDPSKRFAHALCRVCERRPVLLIASAQKWHPQDALLFTNLTQTLRMERGTGPLLLIVTGLDFETDDFIELKEKLSVSDQSSSLPVSSEKLAIPPEERVTLDSTGWLDEQRQRIRAQVDLGVDLSTSLSEDRDAEISISLIPEASAEVSYHAFEQVFDRAFKATFETSEEQFEDQEVDHASRGEEQDHDLGIALVSPEKQKGEIRELLSDEDEVESSPDLLSTNEKLAVHPDEELDLFFQETVDLHSQEDSGFKDLDPIDEVITSDRKSLSASEPAEESSEHHSQQKKLPPELFLSPEGSETPVQLKPQTGEEAIVDALQDQAHNSINYRKNKLNVGSQEADLEERVPIERGSSPELFDIAQRRYGDDSHLFIGVAAAGHTASIGQVSALWRGVVDRPLSERTLSEYLWESLSRGLGSGVLVETKHQRFSSEPSFRFNDPEHHSIWYKRWIELFSPRLRRRAHRNLATWIQLQEVNDIALPQVSLTLVDHWVEGGELYQAAVASFKLAQLLLERGDGHFAKRALQRTVQLLGPEGSWEYWYQALELLLRLALERGDELAAILISRQLIDRSWRLGEISRARRLCENLTRLYQNSGQDDDAHKISEWASSLPLDDHISALFDHPQTMFSLHPKSFGISSNVEVDHALPSRQNVFEHPTLHAELPPPNLDQESLMTPDEYLLPIPQLHTLEAPPPTLLQVLVTLRDRGYEAYVVGGSIRDRLLGRPVNDWDLTTSALPEEVIECFEKVIETGIDHGTVTVVLEGDQIEVTTYRVDGEYKDGRRPEQVSFTRSLSEDLLRRDFTINAIAWDPIKAELCDPYHGVNDLQRKLLRAVGDPYARFQEDGLRVLRAVRFATVLGFEIDPETERGATEAIQVLRSVSSERIQVELFKTLMSPYAHRGLELIRKLGIVDICFPELPDLPSETWSRLTKAIRHIDGELTPRISLIFHAYQSCFLWPKSVLAEQVKLTLKKLKVSNRVLNDCLHAIKYTALDPTQPREDAQIRSLAAKMGVGAIEDIWNYREAWLLANGVEGQEASIELEAWRLMKARMTDLEVAAGPHTVKDLRVNGNDLCDELDLFPSRAIGELLNDLLRWVWEDPQRNQRDQLLERGRELAIERGLV